MKFEFKFSEQNLPLDLCGVLQRVNLISRAYLNLSPKAILKSLKISGLEAFVIGKQSALIAIRRIEALNLPLDYLKSRQNLKFGGYTLGGSAGSLNLRIQNRGTI